MTDANQATRVSNATNKRAIRATVIGLRKRKGDVPHPKDLEEGKPEPGQSKALAEDPFEALTAEGRLIEPPFDMLTMAMLPEHSSELGQCIEAYEVNIEGFGYRFVPRIRSDVDLTKVDPVIMGAMRREKTRLENFFAYCSGRLSWVETRRRVRNDLETTGNGYIEVVRNAAGQIQSLNHLPSYQMRLGGQDQEPVKVALPIHELQEDGSIKIVRVPSWERFRRFAQSRSLLLRHATHVGRYTIRWFKEFGDPRVYDYETGEELKGEDIAKVPPENRANEVIHFKLYSPRSPYGLPRTVGNLLSIFGARAAEEINYVTFRNNNIPSMLLLVSNGQLTEGSIERLESFVESQIVGSDNYSKFLLVEAEALGEEGEDTGHVKIEVEKLVDQQHKDALFQNYSGNADSRIRRAFRLPPIFVGRCHSADTEYLTPRGWKTFDQVREGEQVGTYDLETGCLVFDTPTARHSYDYEGKLCHIRNRGFDALVTPNHTLWLRPSVAYARAEKNWRKVLAEDVHKVRGANNKRIEMVVSGDWVGEDVPWFVLPANERLNIRDDAKPSKNVTRDQERAERRERSRQVPMDAFLRFVGYFIADGSTVAKHRGQVALTKRVDNPTHDRMVQCLHDLDLKFARVDCSTENRKGESSLRISHCGLWEWLREHCGTESNNKRIPVEFLKLAPRQLRILVDAMVECDGHHQPKGSPDSFCYSTVSKVLNDQLHEVCFKLGYALTSRCDRHDGWQDAYVSYGHLDAVHTFDRDRDLVRVPYTGKVACFTVKTGLLVTRRNGRVLVSGNSDDYTRATADTSRRLADEQIFAPERNNNDDAINRLLFPDMGILYHKYKSNTPNTTDNAELVKILGGAEKTGGMTPRIARLMLEDILGQDLPGFPTEFADKADLPFSLLMAEAVQNKADPTEPGQQVTAVKALDFIEKLTGGDLGEDDEAELAKTAVAINRHFEKRWRREVKDALAG